MPVIIEHGDDGVHDVFFGVFGSSLGNLAHFSLDDEFAQGLDVPTLEVAVQVLAHWHHLVEDPDPLVPKLRAVEHGKLNIGVLSFFESVIVPEDKGDGLVAVDAAELEVDDLLLQEGAEVLDHAEPGARPSPHHYLTA